MRTALENKKKLRWMIGLMAIAIIAVAYDFRGFFNTASPPLPGTTTSSAATKQPAIVQTDRETRFDPESLSNQQHVFEIGARNIFRMREAAPNPKPPDSPPNPPRPTFPDPPKPSLAITFYGYADRYGRPRQIFLQNGDRSFLAKVGETVAGRYKVIEISRESVMIEDTLQNFQQRVLLLSK